jgi:hypothetical protein
MFACREGFNCPSFVEFKSSQFFSHSSLPFREFDSLVIKFWFNNGGHLANKTFVGSG